MYVTSTGGAYTFRVKNWSLDWSADMLDTTDTNNQGYKDVIKGLESASGSFEFDWDSTIVPITPGTGTGSGYVLKLYFDLANTKYIQISKALISSVSLGASVGDVITFTYNFQSMATTATGQISYETS